MSQAQRLQGLKGPVASGMAAIPPTSKAVALSSKVSNKNSTKKDSKATAMTGLTYNTPQQKNRLDKCDWGDRLVYVSRMLLGGNNVNGFLRGTATAQRIKKQRARQVGINRKTAAAAQAAVGGVDMSEVDKKDKKASFDQEEEEQLKKEIMNPRTLKKLKSEMEASLQFCVQMHNLLRGVIFDVDHKQSPHLPPYLVVGDEKPNVAAMSAAGLAAFMKHGPPTSYGTATSRQASNMPWAVRPNAAPNQGTQSKAKSASSRGQHAHSTASPGNPEGSTLRKMRKKKLPPNAEPPSNLPEFDSASRRLVPKKEHNYRLFETLRFRGLRAGDFVAARTTSRDLWILARVLKDYPVFDMAPLEFLQLTDTRRDSVFREKVLVKDVEEKDGASSAQVARKLVLPLPRTYSEAAEWGTRMKKGMRVYAMYPQTTSLYPATVIDSTTYCREDDDIIVVEFDGEEPDPNGQMPQYHIPARFASLVPRELPASQPPGTAAKSNKRKSMGNQGSPSKQQKTDDLLSFEFDGNFDNLDLDFDAPLGEEDEDPGFPPLF